MQGILGLFFFLIIHSFILISIQSSSIWTLDSRSSFRFNKCIISRFNGRLFSLAFHSILKVSTRSQPSIRPLTWGPYHPPSRPRDMNVDVKVDWASLAYRGWGNLIIMLFVSSLFIFSYKLRSAPAWAIARLIHSNFTRTQPSSSQTHYHHTCVKHP